MECCIVVLKKAECHEGICFALASITKADYAGFEAAGWPKDENFNIVFHGRISGTEMRGDWLENFIKEYQAKHAKVFYDDAREYTLSLHKNSEIPKDADRKMFFVDEERKIGRVQASVFRELKQLFPNKYELAKEEDMEPLKDKNVTTAEWRLTNEIVFEFTRLIRDGGKGILAHKIPIFFAAGDAPEIRCKDYSTFSELVSSFGLDIVRPLTDEEMNAIDSPWDDPKYSQDMKVTLSRQKYWAARLKRLTPMDGMKGEEQKDPKRVQMKVVADEDEGGDEFCKSK